ncbi:hypothetical protein TWF102_011058 [Orbilia oligospora]|uniref:Uncharacterized protein n=1 Tax=Orbilia oligospora TaxID=2813651 RepID=A0A7C8J0R5_ORBOL|nr:hypothetical protein TWF102_011058 [Orbilia oligospora]KAF3092511.1 hypothetical protein TWF103_011231 [Orbilia oligospora]
MRLLIITLMLLHHASVTIAGKWGKYGDWSDSFKARFNCDWQSRSDHRNQFPPNIMGDSNEPPGTNPFAPDGDPGYGDIAFTGPECKVGIWKRGMNNELGPGDMKTLKVIKWVVPEAPYTACYPFGIQEPGSCINLSFPNDASSFIVTGYCECEFFDHDNCEGGLFKAFNRADGSLKTNGPHNDMINSYRCYETKQLDRWQGGQVKFYAGGKHGRDMVIDEILPTMPEWNALGGFSGCRVMPPEVEEAGGVQKVKLNGVSCMFFDNWGCKHPAMFWEGSMGRIERSSGLDGKVRSYRCFAPWGIGYHRRDDGRLPEPN